MVSSSSNSISRQIEFVGLKPRTFPCRTLSHRRAVPFSNSGLQQCAENCVAQRGLSNFFMCSSSARNLEMVTPMVIHSCAFTKFRWDAFFDCSYVSVSSTGKSFISFQPNSHLCTSFGPGVAQVCVVQESTILPAHCICSHLSKLFTFVVQSFSSVH